MNPAVDPDPASLENLHDIVLPAPISWWPLAPGWYVVAAVLSLVSIAIAWRFIRRSSAERYRRVALRELHQLAGVARRASGRRVALSPLPGLLKRAALGGFTREQVASLAGERWLQFLDATCGSTRFTDGPGRVLLEIAYRPSGDTDLTERELDDVVEVVEYWLRHHDRKRAPIAGVAP